MLTKVMALTALVRGRGPHRILTAWDAQWYAGIAEHGYGYTGRTLAGEVVRGGSQPPAA
jgi:hypothetical protein